MTPGLRGSFQVNLIRIGGIGGDKTPALMLAELDTLAKAGIFAMISVPTPGHCNDTVRQVVSSSNRMR